MKKKKRLRYSELDATAAEQSPEAAAPLAPPSEPLLAPPVAPPLAPPVAPRPKRNSTPVELARALTAARSAEAPPPPPELTDEDFPLAARPIRDRTRAKHGFADLLMFRVGKERFAVELLAVDEVIDLPVIHHVPEMPPAMLGVVTVRGRLTPVYSPHIALGLPLAHREAVLIFRRGTSRIGVLIDDVDDTVSLDLRELREAHGASEVDSVVLGVIRHADLLVAIVDANALIAACQSAALQETA